MSCAARNNAARDCASGVLAEWARAAISFSTSSAAQLANSLFNSSIAASARVIAARSSPGVPLPPPSLALSILGGMNNSMGCSRGMISPGGLRGRFLLFAPFGTLIFLGAAPAAAGAKIDFGADKRPGTLDHRLQPLHHGLDRNRLGDEFIDAGIARLA